MPPGAVHRGVHCKGIHRGWGLWLPLSLLIWKRTKLTALPQHCGWGRPFSELLATWRMAFQILLVRPLPPLASVAGLAYGFGESVPPQPYISEVPSFLLYSKDRWGRKAAEKTLPSLWICGKARGKQKCYPIQPKATDIQLRKGSAWPLVDFETYHLLEKYLSI